VEDRSPPRRLRPNRSDACCRDIDGVRAGRSEDASQAPGARGPNIEVWIGLISVVVGAAAEALATFIATRNRIDLEQRANFDHELCGLRLPHYQDPHHVSERPPRQFPTGEEPTRVDLRAIREAFHECTSGDPPLACSLRRGARERYFDLMNDLESIGERSGDAVV
jgi:hypothetical protein